MKTIHKSVRAWLGVTISAHGPLSLVSRFGFVLATVRHLHVADLDIPDIYIGLPLGRPSCVARVVSRAEIRERWGDRR